jgi:hypothetical protein
VPIPFKKRRQEESPAATRNQRIVRYLGASGYRRFSAGKRDREQPASSAAWLTVIAVLLAALALLGIWQETRQPQTKKPATAASMAAMPVSSH